MRHQSTVQTEQAMGFYHVAGLHCVTADFYDICGTVDTFAIVLRVFFYFHADSTEELACNIPEVFL
jgi:orotidine-5'-phosphate decarboxylase